MDKTEKQEKKRGRVPGTPTIRTTLLIEEDLVEWGKQKPGGLSELVRKLLRDAKEKDLTSTN